MFYFFGKGKCTKVFQGIRDITPEVYCLIGKHLFSSVSTKRTAHSKGVLDDYLITVDTTSLDQHKLFYLHHHSSESENCLVSVFHG